MLQMLWGHCLGHAASPPQCLPPTCGASVPGPSEATLSSHVTRGRRVHRKRPRRTGVVWKCQLLARWHALGCVLAGSQIPAGRTAAAQSTRRPPRPRPPPAVSLELPHWGSSRSHLW